MPSMILKRLLPISCSLVALTSTASANVRASPESLPSPGSYSQQRPSRDGIGKVYMGREISFVMGHRGIDWLERRDREKEERTDLVVEGMELAPDAVVADIGAGSGHFTFRISPRVPKGRVLAVDIQPEMLSVLEQRSQQQRKTNVEAVQGSKSDPNLEPESVDAVLMVDAYHEFSHPNEMMQSIFYALKQGGKIYLLEYRGEDPDVPIKPLHKMTQAQAIKEMEAVGLKHLRTDDFLPWQHFMVFEKTK